MTIARTYYRGIPVELHEAADVDGADELVFFFKILLPVCTPVIAVLALWQFVAMWNSYFDAMIYLNGSACPACRAFKICHNYYLQPPAFGDVSVFPEIF